ncbi:MAG: DUF2254 domain-containing protein [Anaerolineae bacterium]|nr:DUF2254 domain-containing protein [Anaerolineae bacterium]
MKTRLANIWEQLQATYWLLPALLNLLAVLLSLVTISLDRALMALDAAYLPWLSVGGPDGARTMLSTIAGSMITIAGVTFSITTVALSLASSQFGPRLLRNLMRDRGNQLVLGTFIATFMYCLLVLPTVPEGSDARSVPHVSVAVGVLLAVASLGVLVYFFHHFAVSIQADQVIANVGQELERAIVRFFPEYPAERAPGRSIRWTDDLPANFEEAASRLGARHSGYVQAIDYAGLMRLAVEHDLVVRVNCRPGDFVARASTSALIWPGEGLDEDLATRIDNAFILGTQRLQTQDVEYAVNQLVEIAVRALSPGVNDPFTAMACIDQLSTALVRLAERNLPAPYRYDEANRLRLVIDVVTMSGIVDAAFNQIRQYGRSSVGVTIRLLETIAVIAAHTHHRELRDALREQATMIKQGSEEELTEVRDRRDVLARFEMIKDVLEIDATD